MGGWAEPCCAQLRNCALWRGMGLVFVAKADDSQAEPESEPLVFMEHVVADLAKSLDRRAWRTDGLMPTPLASSDDSCDEETYMWHVYSPL